MKPQARAIAMSPPSLLRRLLLLWVVLAVSAQAYLVQTHVHGQPVGSPLQVSNPAPAPVSPGFPIDPATCQLCKEMIHAGVAVTPAAPALAILLGWMVVARPVVPLPASAMAPAIGWQGRAPPHA